MSFYLDGSGDYLQNTGTPPVVGYGANGFTIAARYKRASTSANARTLVSLGQSGTANDAFSLIVGSDASVIARARDTTTQNNATTTTTANDTNWHHAAAVFTSATSRAAFLDGGGKGTSTTSRTPASSTRLRVGSLHDTTSEMYGYVAYVAIWSIALSDAEVAQLAAGADPSSIQNAYLLWHCPMQVDESPAQDVIGTYDLTLAGNTVYSSDNPPLAISEVIDDALTVGDGYSFSITGSSISWSVTPAVSSQTDTAYTVGATRGGAASVLYGVAVCKGDTAPSVAQIKLGKNAANATAKAASSSASGTGAVSITLTPSDSPAFPVYDMHFVLSDGTNDSTRQSLPNEALDAPTGYLRMELLTVSETGSLHGTAAAPGDVWQTDNDTVEDAYALTLLNSGDFQIAASGDEDRLSFTQKLYDVSAQQWLGPGTVYINNQAPAPVTDPLAFMTGMQLERNSTITPINMVAECADAEGDTISVSVISGTWPTGLAMGGSPNYTLSGTPTEYGRVVVTVRWADALGEYYDEAITVNVGVALPDVVGDSLASAQAQLALASLTLAYQQAYSETVPANDVIAMSPAATTVVPYDQEVTLTVSLGPEP